MDTDVQIAENGPERSGISRLLRFVPTWKGNLFVFGLLIIIILAYFYWQVQQVHHTFLGHVQQNSKMLAGVIKLNADSAVLSQEVVEEIMQTHRQPVRNVIPRNNQIRRKRVFAVQSFYE